MDLGYILEAMRDYHYSANIHFPLCLGKNALSYSTVFGLGHMTCFGDRVESEKRLLEDS